MNLFGVGPTEILVVLIVILVLFGPDKLPELAKKIGGTSREIRDNLKAVNEQMNTALETSMEVDKARMIPPAPAAAPTETTTPPADELSLAAAPISENQIMPDLAAPPAEPSNTLPPPSQS